MISKYFFTSIFFVTVVSDFRVNKVIEAKLVKIGIALGGYSASFPHICELMFYGNVFIS